MATPTGTTISDLKLQSLNTSAFFNPTAVLVFHDSIDNPIVTDGLITGDNIINLPSTVFSGGGLTKSKGAVIKSDSKSQGVQTAGYMEDTREYEQSRDLTFSVEYQEEPHRQLLEALYGISIPAMGASDSQLLMDLSGSRATKPLRTYFVAAEEREPGQAFIKVTILPYCVVESAPDETYKGDGDLATWAVDWKALKDDKLGTSRLEVWGGKAFMDLAKTKGYKAA